MHPERNDLHIHRSDSVKRLHIEAFPCPSPPSSQRIGSFDNVAGLWFRKLGRRKSGAHRLEGTCFVEDGPLRLARSVPRCFATSLLVLHSVRYEELSHATIVKIVIEDGVRVVLHAELVADVGEVLEFVQVRPWIVIKDERGRGGNGLDGLGYATGRGSLRRESIFTWTVDAEVEYVEAMFGTG